MAPRISIVIPAYNRERFIEATLQSVRGQSLADWELVVFDDGSTDDTAVVARRVAAEDSRVRIESGPNGGVASARNRGLSLIDPRSEFVALLDSDDLWEPDALETLVRALQSNPRLVGAHGLARCIDEVGDFIPGDDLEERMRDRRAFRETKLVAMNPDEPVDFGALVYHNYVITPGILVMRHSALDAVGEFDPETDPADDWDFAIRLSREGDIGYVEQIVLNWRRHGDTLTQTSPRWKSAYFRVRRKMLADPTNTADQRRLARLGYTHIARSTAQDAWVQLRHGRVKEAAKAAARAADGVARYVVARMLMAVPWTRASA
jgi:glycosyltransferase involved in cell wall biosynthesis